MKTVFEGEAERVEEIGLDVARDFVAERFSSIVERLSDEMAEALPKLETLWGSLIKEFGRCASLCEIASEKKAGFITVSVPMAFERRTLDLAIAFAGDRIVGLHILPHKGPVAPWSPPAYADPTAFRDMEIRFGHEPAALPGTLTRPVGVEKPPIVILVHGSGALDRDETIGPNRPFRDLAEGLATRGIAVLRYDKRTRVYPESFAAMTTLTVKDETTDDVTMAIAFLQARSDVDPARIVVIGHSLGGTLGPRIAVQNSPVSAIVVLAGAARPLPDIVIAQMEYLAGLDGPVSDADAQTIANLKAEAARASAARPGDDGPPFFGAPLSYWADLNAYDPAQVAASLTIPMPILQGGRDYQVTIEDFNRFRAALSGHDNVSTRLLAGLNHQFMPGVGRSTPAEYDTPGHVDAEAVDLIAAFVLSQ